MAAPNHQPNAIIPHTACEIGFWECDIGNGLWVSFEWPISSILEQAFCRKHSSVQFVARKMSYRLEFEQAMKPEGHFEATQVNNDTGARRKVRRWASREHKQGLEHHQQLQAAKDWKEWLKADWTWLLFESSADHPAGFVFRKAWPPIPEIPPSREAALGPPCQLGAKQEYSLGSDCNFSSPWWPEPIRSWPTTGLRLAAHPGSERCNFALHRLEPPKKAGCPSTAEELEWHTLESLWTQGTGVFQARSSMKLGAAFRIQNRGLIHGFAAHRQAMASRSTLISTALLLQLTLLMVNLESPSYMSNFFGMAPRVLESFSTSAEMVSIEPMHRSVCTAKDVTLQSLQATLTDIHALCSFRL